METDNNKKTEENKLVVFDEIKANVALLKEENANMIFDYTTVQGERLARSHVFKLKKMKTQISALHKDVKAEALAHCRAVDGEKNWLIEQVDGMIDVHMSPINEIVLQKRKAEEAKAEAERVEKARIEQERLDAIATKEEEVAFKQAELKAQQVAADKAEEERQAKIKAEDDERKEKIRQEEMERQAKVQAEEDERKAKVKAEEDRIFNERARLEAEKKAEDDKREAVEAARLKAEADKKAAIEKAEADKQAAVEAEKEKARQAEANRLAAEEAMKADDLRIAEAKRKQAEGKKHRDKIDQKVSVSLLKLFPSKVGSWSCEKYALKTLEAIKNGDINNVTINY